MANPGPKLTLVRDRPLPIEEPSMAELVHAARAGDRASAAALYDRTADVVIGLTFRLIGNDHELDDLVQDTYVTALSRLHDLEDPQAFSAWLCSIAVRNVQKRLAKRTRRRALGLVQNVEVDPDLIVSTHAPPDIALEVRHLYQTVARLDPEERIAILLRRVEGYSIDEVSRAMGLSVATVKRRIAAADRALDVHKGSRSHGGRDDA